MKRATILVTGLLASAVAAVGGCASNNNGGGHAGHSADSGMMCPTCETVWVAPKGSGSANPRVQAMTWGRGMVCPDCDAMAKAYFQDGQKVLHDCPSCKVTPRPTTPITPTHPKGTHS